jgi:hypothetical protein
MDYQHKIKEQDDEEENARSSESLALLGLNDQDVKELETGMDLIKLNSDSLSQSEDNQRFFRLDLTNRRIVASTKEFLKKQKICT